MEDAMFSGIFGGLTTEPKQSTLISPASQLIAEPAQVMVMVPGTRTAQAESKLATLRFYIFGFCLLFVAGLVSWLYFYFFKAKKYEGRELPGAVKSLKVKSREGHSIEGRAKRYEDHALTKPLKAEAPNKYEDELNSLPVLSSSLAQEDIVQVYGTLPVWSSDSESAPIEPKVSENNNEINRLIKSREDLTKHFESLTKLK